MQKHIQTLIVDYIYSIRFLISTNIKGTVQQNFGLESI